MAATAFRSEGFGPGPDSRPAVLGSERESAHAVPFGHGKHGQESFLDLSAGRRLYEPSAGRAQRSPGNAPACAGSRELAEYQPADGDNAEPNDGNSTGRPSSRLRARIRSVARIRGAVSRLSRLGSGSGILL